MSKRIRLSAAAAALLREERKLLAGLRGAILMASYGVSGPTKSHLIVSLRHATRGVQESISQALSNGHESARVAASEAVGKELTKVEKALAAAGYAVSLRSLPAPVDHESRALSEATAASLTAAWVRAVHRAIVTDIQDPVHAGTLAVDPQLRRAAATETASTIAQTHNDAVDASLEDHENAEWLAAVFKMWDATIDARTCTYCLAMDRKMIPAVQFFPEIPAHPNCRCTEELIIVPAKLPNKQQDEAA